MAVYGMCFERMLQTGENHMKEQQLCNQADVSGQADPRLVEAVLDALCEKEKTPLCEEKNTGSAVPSVDLVGIGSFVLKKLWLVLLLALSIGACAGFIAGTKVEYTATAKAFMGELNEGGIDSADVVLSNGLRKDYLEVFKTYEVHQTVRDKLDVSYSNAALEDMVSVTSPVDSHILYIEATASDPFLAADIANAYVDAADVFVQEVMKMQGIGRFSPAVPPEEPGLGKVIDSFARGALAGCVLAGGILFVQYRRKGKNLN